MTVDEYFLIKPTPNGYSFKKRWITTILPSINGIDEQRSALLTWPRRSIEMAIFPSNAGDLNYIKRVLFKNLHLSWGIPFWQDKTVLTSQALSGQATLNVGSTQYRNFEVGSLCLLFKSRLSNENYVGTILSLTPPSTIVLTANLSVNWPVGTEVYPIMKSKIQAQQEIDLYDFSKGKIIITATEDYDSGVTRPTHSIATFPTYLGIPVFNLRPNSGQLKQSFYHPYDYLSFLGKSLSESNWGETAFPMEGEYLVNGRDCIWELLDFFDYHKGRWGNFWFPSWQNDIVVTQPFYPFTTQLTIEDIEYSAYWLGTEAGKYIVILWPDNEMVFREIIGSPSPTTLDLDSRIGRRSGRWVGTTIKYGTGMKFGNGHVYGEGGYLIDELRKILVSFLFMGRFDQDEIAIEYITDEIGKVSLAFKTLSPET